MTEPVPVDEIEGIVGIERHATDHYARAVSSEQTIYILHSQKCRNTHSDLTECEYSVALDEGIDENNWSEFQDRAVKVEIRNEALEPEWVEIPEDERFAPGTRVKAKDDTDLLWDIAAKREYVIEAYVDADERDHPLPYYLVDGFGDHYCSGFSVPHISLVKVMSAKEHAKAMKMPKPKALMSAISSAMHHTFGDEGIEIHTSSILKKSSSEWPEGEHPFKHGVEFYGRTEGGRSFGATIRLTALWETDE